jgi:chromosome segregation ATPase
MTLDDDVDDQELAGLVAFHRGRAAGHRRAFRDALDLLQAAAARAADAESELVEQGAEVSALRQRLQNDSQGHRVQLQQLQQQLADEVAAHQQQKAKVQQMLDTRVADLEAVQKALDAAGAPRAGDHHRELSVVERIEWLHRRRNDDKAAAFACRMRHRDKVVEWFAEEGIDHMRAAVLSAFFELTGARVVPPTQGGA